MVICKIPVTFSVLPMGEDLLGMGVGQRSSRYGGGTKIFGKTFHMWRSNFWASDLQFLVFIFLVRASRPGGTRALCHGASANSWDGWREYTFFMRNDSTRTSPWGSHGRHLTAIPANPKLETCESSISVCLFVCVVCFLPRNLILPNQKLDGSRPEQIYLA